MCCNKRGRRIADSARAGNATPVLRPHTFSVSDYTEKC
jgi:hypothetical protein